MSGWTAARVDRLKVLWKEGLSAAQIAGELGWTTRNAVISKVHRLGLAERGLGFHHPTKITRRTKAQALVDNRLKMRAKREPVVKAAPVPFVERTLAGAPAPKMLTIFQLTSRTCKWPAGEMPPFTYCGHDAEEGEVYCEAHCVASYPNYVPVRLRPRQRAA